MKSNIIFLMLGILLSSIGCNKSDDISADIQAGQDLVKGEWIISEVSESLVGTLSKEAIQGGQLVFLPCDAKNTDGQFRLCAGQATIDGTRYSLYYYNDIADNEFELTILLEPPYSTSELSTIKAFSGTYEFIKNRDEIQLILKRRGTVANNDRNANFKLIRK